jgi:RNA polymerase sigma factor (sigma-70 family)
VSGDKAEAILSYLFRVVGPGEAAQLSDGELLDRYLRQRCETAFGALLVRHGRMVVGVCRRILLDEHDVEDVFQATFLLLARKGESIRKRNSLGSWLYGVAYRLAVRVRTRSAARRPLPQQIEDVYRPDPVGQLCACELRAGLDEELTRLPDRLRSPLLLCYLQGQTQDAAARQLGCTKNQLRRRLGQGLDALRRRLTRRGLTFSAGTLAPALERVTATAAVPPPLLTTTGRAAADLAAGSAGLSAPVAALLETGVPAGPLSRAKVVLTVVVLGGLSAGVLTYGGQMALPPASPEALTEEPTGAPAMRGILAELDREPQPSAPSDEPLPAGARLRLGVSRFWHGGAGMVRLAFAPDGKTLASARNDRLFLWDVATGREIRQIRPASIPPPPGVSMQPDTWRFQFSPNGKILAVVENRLRIHLWDPASGAYLRLLALVPPGRLVACAFSPDNRTLASLGDDNQVRLWGIQNGQEIHRFALPAGDPWGVLLTFCAAGKLLATTQGGQPVRLWDVATGEQVRAIPARDRTLTCLSESPDGKQLATGSLDGKVRLWDVQSGQQLRLLEMTRPVHALTFSADGKLLAAAGLPEPAMGTPVLFVRSTVNLQTMVARGETCVWRVKSGERLCTLEGLQTANSLTAFSPDGRLLAQDTGHGRIRLVEVASGHERHADDALGAETNALSLSPDGSMLAAGGVDHAIRLWKAPGAPPQLLRGHANSIAALAFSPDGRLLASGASTSAAPGTDTTVCLWDVAAGALAHGFKGLSSGAVALAFSPDGEALAALDRNGTTVVWRVQSKKELFRREGAWVRSPLVFSPDSRTLYYLAGDSPDKLLVCGCDTATGRRSRRIPALRAASWPLPYGPWEPFQLPNSNPYFGAVKPAQDAKEWRDLLARFALSPDGALLAARQVDTTVGVWRVEGGGSEWHRLGRASVFALPHALPDREIDIAPLAFSPDGQVLAAPVLDDAIGLWDVQGGTQHRCLSGHRGLVTCLTFSRDGGTLASASMDGTILLWDMKGK